MSNNNFQAQYKSSLGQSFIKSPLGQAFGIGNNDVPCTFNGVGAFIPTISIVNSTTILPLASAGTYARRQDSPYGSFVSATTTTALNDNSQIMGKQSAGSTVIFRGRWLSTFAIPSLTNCVRATMKCTFIAMSNSLESFVPVAYDSPGNAYNSLGSQFASFPFNSSGGTFSCDVSVGWLSAYAGSNLHFVMGEDAEMNNAGAGASSGLNARYTGAAANLVLDFS